MSPRRTLSDGSVISLLLMSSFRMMASRSLRSVTVQKTQNLVTPCTCTHKAHTGQSQSVADSFTVGASRAIAVAVKGICHVEGASEMLTQCTCIGMHLESLSGVLRRWLLADHVVWCTCDQLPVRRPSTTLSALWQSFSVYAPGRKWPVQD